MSEQIHHSRCWQSQAWDVDNVPCSCPSGWPRKEEPAMSEPRDEWMSRALRAEAALRDISELMADAGVPGGTPLPAGVIWLRDRAERAEAKVADAQRHHAVILEDPT